MFVHGESTTPNINKGDIKVFMRLGRDFTNNYYEYEIPLRLSTIDIQSLAKPDSIWLAENDFDFPLSLLTDLKTNGILMVIHQFYFQPSIQINQTIK